MTKLTVKDDDDDGDDDDDDDDDDNNNDFDKNNRQFMIVQAHLGFMLNKPIEFSLLKIMLT